ncbi:hypothetical protein LOD99_13674 [Oopsacas minuta]|uniref:Intraflagellar transport protein 57 homolog n=1 Tax=Oopsacas minuta TaxID=111878 RepID=A0AAV7KHS1_9METZ|nr:hypothetical protein LOD99_13674 [Oopsacas minuta]
MAEDESVRRGDHENQNTAHKVVMMSESIMDTLKIMNYESKFCYPNTFLPFPRHYFAFSLNPGEQFHAFSCLSAFLFNHCGIKFEMPQEYDDPNSTVAGIIEGLKKLGIAVDFAPGKLKTGFGEYVCTVLSDLCAVALNKTRFTYRKPIIPKNKTEDEIIEEDDSEVQIDKVEEAIIEEKDSDEEAFLQLSPLGGDGITQETNITQPSRPQFDPNDWQLEVERAIPALKVQLSSSSKDWRYRLDQMLQFRDAMGSVQTNTKGKLEDLHQELTATLDKVATREKYMNIQLDDTLKDLRVSRESHSEVRQKYEVGMQRVNELTQALNNITDELEGVKIRMDEHGTNMTDATPVVRIKHSLQRIKTENMQMDLRIGVLQHLLTASKLKEKSLMQEAAPDGSAGLPTFDVTY